MNFDSLDEILNFAIEKEKEAIVFYEDIADKDYASGSKQTFLDFAQEEKKHQKMLEDFSVDDSKIKDYKLNWVADMKRSDYIVDITFEPGMSYPDILRMAMKREEKALKLYNQLGSQTTHEGVQKLFQILSQEEAKHKQVLENIYDDFMAKQGD